MKKNKYLVAAVVLFSTTLQGQTLNDAIRLTDNEQYEEATAAFRQLIAKESANATNYYYFGENYLLSDVLDSALIMYDLGAKADPASFLPAIGRAKHLLHQYSVAEMKRNSNILTDDLTKHQSNYDKLIQKSVEDETRLAELKANAAAAEALYQKALANVKAAHAILDETVLKAGPKNAQVFTESADALIHLKNKDLDKAKGYLEKAEALQPKNPEIKILFGDLYSELNNGTLAADYYNKALDLDPKSVKAIVNKARLYMRSRNYEGAAEEFRNAIKIEEAFAPAHRELGESYYYLKKLEEAKAEYKRYLEISKNNCSARMRYAAFLYLSKDYTGALTEISQLGNSCDANNARLLRVKMYSLYEIKDSVKALDAAKKLFEKVSEENLVGQDYEYYGKILMMNNMDSIGVDMLRKAYLMDKNRCDLLTDIYKGYEKMKKYCDASLIMQEKIQGCKGATVADYFKLGQAFYFCTDDTATTMGGKSLTHFMRADTAFAKVNELSPKYASGFLWRAKANTFLDSTMSQGLAKVHYEKYIEIATTDTAGVGKFKGGLVEAYKYLIVYNVQVLKNNKAALEIVNTALEVDPENQELREWKKSLEFELDPKNKKGAGGK